jgi:hypothetical protein
MKTSRRQLDRLFEPAIPSVALDTLHRAANALGCTLNIELVSRGRGAKKELASRSGSKHV